MASRIRGTVSDVPDFEYESGGSWFPYLTPPAVISGTPTGTYTDAGIDYAYYEFTASGTLTCTTAGTGQILIVSGGGGAGTSGGFTGGCGGGGAAYLADVVLDADTYTVTVGAGGSANTRGGFSGFFSSSAFTGPRLGFYGGGAGGSSGNGGGNGSSGGGGSNATAGSGDFGKAYGGNGSSYAGGGAGGDATANTLGGIGPGLSFATTGSSVTYGAGNYTGGVTPSANTGQGGKPSGGAGASGIVVVRVKV